MCGIYEKLPYEGLSWWIHAAYTAWTFQVLIIYLKGYCKTDSYSLVAEVQNPKKKKKRILSQILLYLNFTINRTNQKRTYFLRCMVRIIKWKILNCNRWRQNLEVSAYLYCQYLDVFIANIYRQELHFWITYRTVYSHSKLGKYWSFLLLPAKLLFWGS